MKKLINLGVLNKTLPPLVQFYRITDPLTAGYSLAWRRKRQNVLLRIVLSKHPWRQVLFQIDGSLDTSKYCSNYSGEIVTWWLVGAHDVVDTFFLTYEKQSGKPTSQIATITHVTMIFEYRLKCSFRPSPCIFTTDTAPTSHMAPFHMNQYLTSYEKYHVLWDLGDVFQRPFLDPSGSWKVDYEGFYDNLFHGCALSYGTSKWKDNLVLPSVSKCRWNHPILFQKMSSIDRLVGQSP